MSMSQKVEVLGEWDNGMCILMRSNAIMVYTN